MFKFFAMTSQGLEDVLLNELEENSFQGLRKTHLGVYFEGDWAECYRANICLRTITRVLLAIDSFEIQTQDDLYNAVLDIPFEEYVNKNATIMVNGNARGTVFKDQRFLTLRTKDAIVDRFRDKFGERPSVDKDNPDLVVNVRVVDNRADVSIDTTGDSLSLRGYREKSVMAPLREHLAAGLIKHTGWKKDIPIVDPMCGSGTFLIEGALMALNRFPALDRKRFQFQKLIGYSDSLYKKISTEYLDSEFQETPVRFYGYDTNREAVSAARINVRAAGLEEYITVTKLDVVELRAPCERGIIIVNPPYGERLNHNDDNLKDVYRDLGFALKNNFKGWEAWVLSGHKELVGLMGLKSTQRIPVYNGSIDCRFLKYEIRAT